LGLSGPRYTYSGQGDSTRDLSFQFAAWLPAFIQTEEEEEEEEEEEYLMT